MGILNTKHNQGSIQLYMYVFIDIEKLSPMFYNVRFISTVQFNCHIQKVGLLQP